MSRNQRVSDIKRAEDTSGVLQQTHIGGQALIEGVMMRGKYNWAAAVRTPDGGIYVEEHDVPTRPDKHGWLYWPVVRGCRALVESLMLGYKALEIAADNAFDFEEDDEAACAQDAPLHDSIECTQDVPAANPAGQGAEQEAAEPADTPAEAGSGDSESKGVLIIGTVLGIVLGLAAFIMLPALLTNLVVGDYNNNPIVWNVVDGIARVVIFILYVWGISFMKDIKRMYMYHGAEHKAIHCFEHGMELTPQNAAQFTTLHVRCGTAFLIMTLILAIIVFSLAPIKEICLAFGLGDGLGQFAVIVLSRIVLIPIVAGLGYELTVKWAGAHPEKKLVKVVLWPGLQMQRLTTAEPDEPMLECAIAAMRTVLAREQLEEGGSAQAEVLASAPEEAAASEEAPSPAIQDDFTSSQGEVAGFRETSTSFKVEGCGGAFVHTVSMFDPS